MNCLLCVDRDDALEDLLVAFRWGVRVGADDRVLVLHVMPKLAWLRAFGRVDPTVAAELAKLPELADEALSEAVAFLSREDVAAERACREGRPAEEILRCAREAGVDLIVMGALGRRDKENFLLGSVSMKVELHADRDVFVVRGSGPTAERYTAIVAVDGSPASLSAVRSLVTKMHVVLADIHLIHVVERPIARGPSAVPDEAIERARAILADEGLECTSEIRHGRPAPEILACARERDARVIAVGARGLGAISGAFMGSVSRRILHHAPCAVLCTHSQE